MHFARTDNWIFDMFEFSSSTGDSHHITTMEHTETSYVFYFIQFYHMIITFTGKRVSYLLFTQSNTWNRNDFFPSLVNEV